MKKIQFSTDHSGIDQHQILQLENKIENEIDNLNKASQYNFEDDRASINLPFDTQGIEIIHQLVKEKQSLIPEYLVVVGIGGSNLGTLAIQEAVLGKLYNQLNKPIKILFADTVDSDLLNSIMSLIKPPLQQGKQVIINGISKSGGTTETIANFQVLLELLKKYQSNYQQSVVITTENNSKFWHMAQNKGFSTLEIPKKVGGRYSVFSPVGLFPLSMVGIDIDKLVHGACNMRDQCLKKDLNDNIAAKSASLNYLHSLQGKNIHDLFFFSSDLESIGKWYRQLMAESIGKEFNIDDKQVFNGITPTVSIGSTDLHSMAQLYLGGPYDKFTSFVHIEKNKKDIMLPYEADYASLVSSIQDRSMEEIMNAILKGTQMAYIKGKRPFVDISLSDKSEEVIGQFLQFKMMEMMYLGAFMNVNPFDQPNVEAYKIETKKILTKQELIN